MIVFLIGNFTYIYWIISILKLQSGLHCKGILIGLYAIRSANYPQTSTIETCTTSDSVQSSNELPKVESLLIERISAEEIGKNLK